MNTQEEPFDILLLLIPLAAFVLSISVAALLLYACHGDRLQ